MHKLYCYSWLPVRQRAPAYLMPQIFLENMRKSLMSEFHFYQSIISVWNDLLVTLVQNVNKNAPSNGALYNPWCVIRCWAHLQAEWNAIKAVIINTLLYAMWLILTSVIFVQAHLWQCVHIHIQFHCHSWQRRLAIGCQGSWWGLQ